MTNSDPQPGSTEESAILEYVRESPIASGFLVVSILAGAILGYQFLEEISKPRRILGGALAGFGSWLLVMVGRIIG